MVENSSPGEAGGQEALPHASSEARLRPDLGIIRLANRISTPVKNALAFARGSKEEKQRLLLEWGYSHKEAMGISKNVGKSSLITLFGGPSYEFLTWGSGGIGWYVNYFKNDFSDPATLTALGVSLVFLASSVWINAELNAKMLTSKLGYCPNGLATGAYYFTRIRQPENIPAQKSSIRKASYFWDIGKQVLAISPTFINPNGAIVANAVGGSLNYLQAAIAGAYYMSRTRPKA